MQSIHLREELFRREEEKLRAQELKVEKEITQNRQERIIREQILRDTEARFEAKLYEERNYSENLEDLSLRVDERNENDLADRDLSAQENTQKYKHHWLADKPSFSFLPTNDSIRLHRDPMEFAKLESHPWPIPAASDREASREGKPDKGAVSLERRQADEGHDSSASVGGEAEFWVPQATPDGKLFYFNTLTYRSTKKLPLEIPSTAKPSGHTPSLDLRAGPDVLSSEDEVQVWVPQDYSEGDQLYWDPHTSIASKDPLDIDLQDFRGSHRINMPVGKLIRKERSFWPSQTKTQVAMSGTQVDGPPNPGSNPPQKARPLSRTSTKLLGRALSKANDAVLLQNVQRLDAALGTYGAAVDLLQQVVARTSWDRDPETMTKVPAITETYTNRIAELNDLTAIMETRKKELFEKEASALWLAVPVNIGVDFDDLDLAEDLENFLLT